MPNQRGFSLIELMATVTILGVLAMLFWPKIAHRSETKKTEGVYATFPPLVQRHQNVLNRWDRGQFRPQTPASKKEKLVVLKDIEQETGIKPGQAHLVVHPGSGSAIVAGGLVVANGMALHRILRNKGTWQSFPEPSMTKDASGQRAYKNTSVWVGVMGGVPDQTIVALLKDYTGDGTKTKKRESFHFYVDGEKWNSDLKRYPDWKGVDGVRGTVHNPQHGTWNFEGKIPSFFADFSGPVLVSSLNGHSVVGLNWVRSPWVDRSEENETRQPKKTGQKQLGKVYPINSSAQTPAIGRLPARPSR